MQLKRKTWLGVILGLLGNWRRGLRFDGTGVSVLGWRSRKLPYSEITAPASVEKGLLLTSIKLSLANGSCLRVSGIRAADGVAFAVELNKFWRAHFQSIIDARRNHIITLHQAIERLSNPRRYPAACLLEPYVELAQEIFFSIPVAIPEKALTREQTQLIESIAGFHRDPSHLREQAIARFIDSEAQEMADFFDRIETHPLTPEQRLAVVTDEDATLVLAGAGSGKTSVIVAKATYLIERGIRKPEDILLMAFGKGAATEMAERIEQRCGAPVAARTFHALAYGIIAEVEGGAPALAAHATDEKHFTDLLRDILLDQAGKSDKLAKLLILWFTESFWPYRSKWDFNNLHEYHSYVENHGLRTLQGELVRSFEESEIANWLYLNGIEYEYEPAYEHPLPGTAYKPDFRLKGSGIYIEHFGVRKECAADGSERLTTAPFVDRDRYLKGMEWKRKTHAEHGTILIETFSYERVEGRLTQSLGEKLKPYVEIAPIPVSQVFERVFKRLGEMGQVYQFTQILGTFLRHFKSAGLSIEECRVRNAGLSDSERGITFLKIFEPIFEEYQQQSGQRIDFEDMITRATMHVKSGRYQSPYRHLLVDEFQDISKGRADLLRALKEQHRETRIFAVGDDWQSIYRFTGSDIHIMRDFGQEFGGKFAEQSAIHRTVDLGRTFRSVDKIAIPARSFVLRNPSQIEKQVIPAGTSKTSAIRVAWAGKDQDMSVLSKLLNEIRGQQQAASKTAPASVLLLGRYRHSRPANFNILEQGHPGLSIRFKTIHASKGLEADHVIILGANSGYSGLPSEIVDDPVLNLVLPRPELFHHAEERRVFYVALTRARLSVTIVASVRRPSTFVTELLESQEYGVAEIGGTSAPSHHCASCGGRLIAERSKTRKLRFVCQHGRLCGASLPACAACGNDLPTRSSSDPDFSVCSCGNRHPACPQCTDGWLVERRGRYGNFLGCVKYPDCTGKKKPSSRTTKKSGSGNRAKPTFKSRRKSGGVSKGQKRYL